MQPLQSLKAPFIVNDDYEASEQIVLLSGQDHDSECLGTAELAAYLSMSEYGKAQENYPLYDYVATQPDQEHAYAGFAVPSAASQYLHVQTPVSHGPSTVPQAPFISSAQYETHDLPYQAPFPFIDASSRHLPEVTRYLPTQGLHGKLHVYIRTNQDVSTPGPLLFCIMFGRRRCDAALTKIDQRGPYYQYALTVDIPPFETTGWHDSQVPLLMHMEDENGQSLGVVEVGDFMYTDGSNCQAYESPADGSRKRKLSDESVDEIQSPPKRIASHTLQGRPQQLSGADRSSQGIALPASPYPSAATPSTYGFSDTYGRPQQQHSAYGHNMSPSLSYQYPSPAVSRASVIAQSPRISAYSPYSRASHLSRSPGTATVPAISRSRVATSPASLTNPPLIRTSTLQPPPTPAAPATVSSQSFNPYAMYPNSKVVLEIKGELDRMAEGWSPDEWDAKRRLVQFRRDQSGSTITTSFEAVSPETRAPNSICISCIWWEEKQECYVTSVDTIYLLESLVAVRFTVEEKNRIRRNLEGFRPLTVSKAKAGSEPFFKIIMGFSNPKPRNIEKDVKVFPWKMLPLALKKIISKYSASYSSTAGALPTPAAGGYGGGPAGPGTEPPATACPQPASSAPSAAYSVSMTSAALSPVVGRSAGPPNLRVAVPQLDSGIHTMYQWQTASQYSGFQYPNALEASARGSLDFSAYIDGSPAAATPAAAQSPHHQGRSSMAAEPNPSFSIEPYQQPGQRTSGA